MLLFPIGKRSSWFKRNPRPLLQGLVFVAVSINFKTVLATPGLPGRAAESLAQFLQVFFVSAVALIPGQTA